MGAMDRLDYYRRLILAYGLRSRSQLSFWHEKPEVNPAAFQDGSRAYYMTFRDKAAYQGPFDAEGVPLLDYRGALGRQYNPIAVAQYGLAQYNRYLDSQDDERLHRCLTQANWLVANLESNPDGVPVWNHHFDWRYRKGLKAPWYSALAQGQGISLLLRAFLETSKDQYRDAAERGFKAFELTTHQGGVSHRDDQGNLWFEEYLVEPPSHILNGFLWSSWGVFDYWQLVESPNAEGLFKDATATVLASLSKYDAGYWSCYELRSGRVRMLASPFYHALHIAQLEVMSELTGNREFDAWAQRWRSYTGSGFKRRRALLNKALFKLLYY